MSDERPERPEGDAPREPGTPAPEPADAATPDDHDVAHPEPFVEASEEIDLGEAPVEDAPGEPAPPRRVSRTTAAVQGAAATPEPHDAVVDPSEAADESADADQAPEHDDGVELEHDDVDSEHDDDVDGDDPDEDEPADDEGATQWDEPVAVASSGAGTDSAEAGSAAADSAEVGDHDADDDTIDETRVAAAAEDGEPRRDAWPFGDTDHHDTAVAASAASTSDAPGGPTEERRRRRRWPILLGVAAVLGLLYVAGWLLTGTRLPADVTVAGVQLGGMSRAEARQTLEDELVPREDEPVRLVSGDESFEIDPADAGLSLDVAGSVERAGGTRSWDPRDMVALVLGSKEVAPALDVDDAALDSAVQAIAETVDVPVTEALITFSDEKPEPREPKDGRVVLKADTARLVQDEYLVQEEPAEVPMADEQPVVDSEGLARAVTEIGEPAVSAPVTIKAGGEDVELPVTAYAPALTVQPVDGRMTPVIDAEELAGPLTDVTTGIGEQAVDASFEIEDGKPVVVPGKEGLGLQPEEMAELLPEVLTEQGDARTVEVEAKVVQPEFTTEDAKKLGITEKISEFTTEYPHAEYRNVNQSRAAALIDGVILEPGETFSFNDTVGERTAANGFTTGSVINGGRFVDELGGGVSQVVTTTYNAAFFAGLEDVEHHPHAFYIDRYPEGREATVYYGSLDLRFTNNLEHGVLIKAFVQKSAPGGVGRTTVQMWGTKQYDVEAGKSERRNERAPRTRYDDADDCVPQAPLVGFDVDIYRTISQGGKVVKRETDTAVYQAADRIVCGEDPDAD